MGHNDAFLNVGTGQNCRRIAWQQERGGQPGLFWLGGFKSDMSGTKAQALAEMAGRMGLGITRFDYSGHGRSEGDVVKGRISDWLEESEAVFANTDGPQILVGSSMGAWLALLLNQHVNAKGPGRVAGLILIAPAVDMTRDLMAAHFDEKDRQTLKDTGQVALPSDYGDPYIITGAFLADGERHLLLNGPIRTHCPVIILQGGRDKAVPVAHALKLVHHLLEDKVMFTLVPDADHSLSRPQDLDLLADSVKRLVAETAD